MRILLSYASQFDKGEGAHVERVLGRMGHEVVPVNVGAHARGQGVPGRAVAGFAPHVHLDDVIAAVGRVDAFLYIEPFGLLPRGVEKAGIPTACIISDVHRNLRARQRLARLFDHVFLYQRHYMDRFAEHPPGHVRWFPWSCDAEAVRDLGVPRDIDVALIGQLFPERKRALDEIAKRHRVNEQRYYRQDEIPAVYSRARIVLNIPLQDDLNQRFFEALMCGALLVTRREVNGQDELFREGEHYVAYTDHADLLATLDRYLADEPARARIAAAGHAEALAGHTLERRLGALVDVLGKAEAGGAPARSMPASRVATLYASLYERMGSVDGILAMAAETKDAALRARLLGYGLKGFARRIALRW